MVLHPAQHTRDEVKGQVRFPCKTHCIRIPGFSFSFGYSFKGRKIISDYATGVVHLS